MNSEAKWLARLANEQALGSKDPIERDQRRQLASTSGLDVHIWHLSTHTCSHRVKRRIDPHLS